MIDNYSFDLVALSKSSLEVKPRGFECCFFACNGGGFMEPICILLGRIIQKGMASRVLSLGKVYIV